MLYPCLQVNPHFLHPVFTAAGRGYNLNHQGWGSVDPVILHHDFLFARYIKQIRLDYVVLKQGNVQWGIEDLAFGINLCKVILQNPLQLAGSTLVGNIG